MDHVTANPDGWAAAQEFELRYWRESWPYRHLPLTDLQAHRHEVACWFLNEMGFTAVPGSNTFSDFQGSVLEVGCGPLGFFELVEGVEVVAQDSLMSAYADHLPFSTLGKRGSVTYSDEPVDQIAGLFDFVVCSNVLDHTADWIQFLKEICHRVKPDGGELLLFTDSRGVPCEGHTQIFSPSQLISVLELLGANHFPVHTVETRTDHCDFVNTIRAAF